MAKTWTPVDSKTILTAVLSQMQGGTLANINIHDFVSIGEEVRSHGMDNVFDAMQLVALEIWADERMYKNRLRFLEVDKATYAARRRKLLVYDKGMEDSGDVNTDVKTNLYDGYDNGTNGGVSAEGQWTQNKPVIDTLDFGCMLTKQFRITEYGAYWETMFNSEAEFIKVWNAIYANFYNEMEQYREAQTRATMLHYFANLYRAGQAVDLVAAFNSFYGTTYTGAQLRSTYLKEYTAFKLSYISKLSLAFENRDDRFHWSPTITRDGVTYNKVMKITPKEDQRLLLHVDNLVYPETMVLPDVFHDEKLQIKNAMFVDYWQSPAADTGIKVTPDEHDTQANAYAQIAGTAVSLDHVVGALYDKNAMFVNMFIEKTRVTDWEASKDYRNRIVHTKFGSYGDLTEKGVLLYEAS